MQVWDCPCGTRNAPTFTACRICGGAPPTIAQPPAAGRVQFCRACRQVAPETATACGNCGSAGLSPGWPPGSPGWVPSGTEVFIAWFLPFIVCPPLGLIWGCLNAFNPHPQARRLAGYNFAGAVGGWAFGYFLYLLILGAAGITQGITP
jgi:hypothetical protein